MTDLAVLGLRFETDGAENANRQLDQIAQKSANAEKATDALSGSNRRAGSAIASMVASIERGVRDLVAMGQAQLILAGHTNTATGATRQMAQATTQATVATTRYNASVAETGRALARVEPGARTMTKALTDTTRNMAVAQQAGLNMSRQFADVGVSLASGISPLMVLIQQGPQIADGFAVAGAAGIGFRGIMASLYATMAPLLPLVIGLAAAAAAIAAPFAIAAQQINAENKNLADGLGLTKEQLEKVKNEGVTMGDVLRGTFKTVAESLTASFGPEIEAVKGFFGDMYQRAVDGAVAAVRAIVGAFGGSVAAIRATWSVLPAAIGDAAVSAANAAIGAIEGMVNGGIRAINRLLPAINAFQIATPGPDVLFSALSEVSIGRLSNGLEGSMRRAGQRAGAAYAEGQREALAGLDRFGARLNSNILDEARNRIRREGGEGEEGAAARQARQVREVETLWAKVNVQLKETGVRYVFLVNELELAVVEMRLIDDLASNAGRGLEDSFGKAGGAISGVVSALSGYRLQLAEIARAEQENRRDASRGLNPVQAARERTAAEVRSYGDMASAAKSFFGEKTAAYKILQGVEMAYRAVQFAGAVQAMALDTAETGSSIGNSIARGAAYAAEAVANIFAKLGPWGFPVAAAALGVIAAVGGKVMGGGGGGAAPSLPSTNTGTGTVLGAGGEQSDSLARSLDMMERYQNRDLEFSSRSLNALRAIQANIGSLTTAIAREMGIGGALDPTGLNQGPTTSGGFLGAFSTTRSSELVGSGINLNGGALADLISRGVSGGLYQIVQTTSRNSGFFGIGASTRTTNNETSTAIDGGMSREFSRVLASLRDGVLSAAGDLGLTGAEAVLDAFQVNLGRISFEGMSSGEISEALNAVFSAVGDDMARAILPGLDAFQRAGEGMLETLSRLATEYRTVDVTLQSIGLTFGAVGLASVAARSRLVELSGGLDAFIEGADFFSQAFLSDAQRIAPVQAAVTAELTRLGIAADIGRSQFADLIMGLDVSTAAGAEMFAALMRLAPAIDQTLTYTEELTGAVTDLGNAADIARQRRSLEIALMDAQGLSAEALAARRHDEVLALDATLRPLQLAIYAALDLAQANEALARQQTEAAAALAQAQQEAAQAVDQARSDLSAAYEREASALKSTQERFDGFAKSLAAFRASLDLDNGLSGASYDVAGSQFRQVADLAALGNEQALGELQGVSQAYLEASKSYSKDSLGYLKDLSAVKIALQRAEGTASRTASNAQQQLAALDASVSGLLTVNNSVLSVRDAIMRLQAAMAGQASLATAAPSWSGQTAGQDFGANPGINRALAGLTGYSGSFGGNAFEAWIASQAASVQSQARSFLAANDIIPGFATGGSFTVGGSGGPDSQVIPLRLTPGEMVDVKRPGDNDNSELVAEIRALRSEVAQLRSASNRTAAASEKTATTLVRVTRDGDALLTEAA